MRACLVVIAVFGMTAVARGDVFAFKDLEGFERCLQLDHLVEKVDTAGGSQTRLLGPAEIQPRCIASAVKLLAAGKDRDQMMEFIKSAKRLSARENAIDLTGVLVDTAIAACNDLAVYEIFIKALSYPKDNTFYLPKVRSVVKRCLKDKQFRQDFLDEQGSSDANVAANACRILLDEKLVKSCKAAP